MRKTPSAPLLALAALAVALLPYAADSGPCVDNPAARDLLVSSYTDSLLNRPKGEDTNFFIRAGGVPNIMLLLDSSGSMNRLPPDGPSFFGGTLPPTGTVGCGLDDGSSGSATFTGSAMYKTLESRRFSPPCGNAVDPSLINDVYKGHAIDYAAQMSVCPHFTPSDNLATGDPGFDPDYYDAANPTAAGTNFFGKDLIIHDNPNRGSQPYDSKDRPRGDGFYYGGVFPHMAAAKTASTIATFCALETGDDQGGRTKADICKQCLTDKGWYYDGVVSNEGENKAETPSLWYTGNYLSFFPPKFLVARKVLKDIIAVQDRIRMAFATFGSNGADFQQQFNPGCDHPETSNFQNNRNGYIFAIDDVDFPTSQGTPLSVALFEVGRYYHSPTAPWFDWNCPAGGSFVGDAPKCSDRNKQQFAICYSCQASTVILLTDGQPTANDGSGLPIGGLTPAQLEADILAGNSGTGILGIGTTVCPNNLCTHFGDYRDNLAKVAFYLNKMDLRANDEVTTDCQTNSGKQGVDTYTLGFGTSGLPYANTILANAAEAGGGRFIPASNTSTLKEGFNAILEEINGRSTSFSVATVSTLQTTSGRSVIVPRFDPSDRAVWEGHLYRYDLYSEFVNLCVPGGAGDVNCDGRCDGVFLQDTDGAYISEDGNGNFMKNDPVNKPTCEQAPACGTNCGVPGSAPANPYWNASEAWGDNFDDTKQGWKTRNVWTVIDRGTPGDGKLDSTDELVKLDTSTVDAAKKLVPYLGLGGNRICQDVAARLTQVGDLTNSATVSTDQVECARTILRYVLGADLFNERGKKTGFPQADQEDLWDRPFLLGDIFHSSPVVVKAPAPRTGVLTELGYENQALVALWSSPTPGGEAGWDAYSKAASYVNRRQVALVGGNDGMVHAFSDSVFCADVDDDRTSDLDEEELGGYYEPRTSGGLCTDRNENVELWGFVPPDLLAKLPFLLGSEHHFFVDGSPMVRDVWVDGTSNDGVTGSGTLDGIKDGNEFHTVAVFGERRGGTRHFALDLTDATEPDSVPKFLWIYPQPNDPEGLTFGETYNDYLPTPPPIGPVRIAAGAAFPEHPGVTPKYTYDGSNTPYHEKWVIILNGGFDPQYVRGRGVHMVDVWTGRELFDFSYPDGSTIVAADDPRWQLRFPVAAPVGMMRWGTAEKMPDRFEPTDNFFDTATFGDAGGQIWTLRFHVPGTIGASGKVNNWFGGRSFQLGSSSAACKLCGGQPFFQITSNGPTPADRVFRTYLGTGDRFNLTDKYGGTCGPSNLRACALRGCTVTLSKDGNLLSAPGPGFAKSGLLQAAPCGALTLDRLNSSAPFTACAVDGSVKVEVTNCPSPVPNNGLDGFTREARVSCVEATNPTGYSCTRVVDVPGLQLPLSDDTDAPALGNWFFSIRTFRDGPATDPLSKPVFVTAAEAKTYDAHRGWVTQAGTTRANSTGMVLIDSTAAVPALATEQSAGWAMYYNHDDQVTIGSTTVTVSWMDERTGSGTTLTSGLVAWNTVQPPLSTVASVVDTTKPTCDVSMCKQVDRRVNYLYGADPATGGISGLFLDAAGDPTRSVASYRLVPAQALQSTVFINKKGQVQVALTGVSPEQGAVNVGAGESEDPITETGVLLVDEELYTCRHADSPVCR